MEFYPMNIVKLSDVNFDKIHPDFPIILFKKGDEDKCPRRLESYNDSIKDMSLNEISQLYTEELGLTIGTTLKKLDVPSKKVEVLRELMKNPSDENYDKFEAALQDIMNGARQVQESSDTVEVLSQEITIDFSGETVICEECQKKLVQFLGVNLTKGTITFEKHKLSNYAMSSIFVRKMSDTDDDGVMNLKVYTFSHFVTAQLGKEPFEVFEITADMQDKIGLFH